MRIAYNYTQQELRDHPEEQLLSGGDVDFEQYKLFKKYFYYCTSYICNRIITYNLPIHMLGSDSDPVIPKEVFEQNAEDLRKMTCGPVELTIFPDWGHEPTHPRNMQEFKAWIKTTMDAISSANVGYKPKTRLNLL